MIRRGTSFTSIVFALSACATEPVGILLTVDADATVPAVTALRVTVTSGEQKSTPVVVPIEQPGDIPPARTLFLSLPPDRVGELRVDVEAMGAAGAIASGSAGVEVSSGGRGAVRVVLAGTVVNGDGGAGVDLVHAADLVSDLTLACVATLVNIGTGDFTVSFALTAAPGLGGTLLTQRATCDNATHWYVAMKVDGTIYVTLASPYVGIDGVTSVNDGRVHSIMVRRRNNILSLLIDGKTEAEASTTAVLESLPPLEIGESASCNTMAVSGVKIEKSCLTVP